jgi:hypothetical protein
MKTEMMEGPKVYQFTIQEGKVCHRREQILTALGRAVCYVAALGIVFICLFLAR